MDNRAYNQALAHLQGFLQIMKENNVACDLEIDLSALEHVTVESLACEVLHPIGDED